LGKIPLNGDDGTPGFGVYVHWPFCAAKCPYCDFNSHVRHGGVDEPAYLDAYVSEIVHMARLTGPRDVTSIFFGGGTPSLMAPATVAAILNAISDSWHVPDGIEITMEANPASSDAERFAGYAAAGVNRLSLGVQALNDRDLKFLGRLHSVDEALKAVAMARRVFARLSFDLIYARPGQTIETWSAELEQAINHAADHLSLYQLTIEDGTPFKALHEAGRIAMPDDDVAADLYQVTQEITAARGLPAYEVSNHAAPGCASRHNLTYWRYGDYAGIGPGAHGRITTLEAKRIATETHRRPEDWAGAVKEFGHGMVVQDDLERTDAAAEMLLMGLRLREGLDLARLEQAFGWQPAPSRLQAMIDLAMIKRIGNTRIAATQSGMALLNAVIAELASPSVSPSACAPGAPVSPERV